MEIILESRFFWVSISAAVMLALAVWSIPGPSDGVKKKGDDKVC